MQTYSTREEALSADRKAPQNREAEAAVLGSMMMSPRAILTAYERGLSAADFYAPAHRSVYNAICALYESDTGVDELVVVAKLKEMNTLEDVGGQSYVLGLTQRVPSLANTRAYVDDVVAQSRRRAIIGAAEQALTLAYDPARRLDEIPDVINAGLETAARTGTQQIGKSLAELQSIYETAEVKNGIPYPYSDLNKINRGQHPGNIIITGGYSSDGKTWWGMQCAEEAASLNYKTGFATLEMPSTELYQRFLAQYPGTSLKDIHNRTDTPAMLERKAQLAKLPLRMFDTTDGMTSMRGIEREIMRAHAEGDPYKYFVIDHMHLMEHEGGGDNLRLGIGQTMSQAKRIAVRYEVVIHFLAQLRRSSDSKGKNKFPLPTMTDLREASQIENIADLIMMVWRERDEEQQQLNTGKLVIAKVRSGRQIGNLPITWHEESCRFLLTPALTRWEPVNTAY